MMQTPTQILGPAYADFEEGVTAGELSSFLSGLYRDQDIKLRLMARGRPYIAPFDQLLPLIPSGGSLLDYGCGVGFLMAASLRYRAVSAAFGYDVNAPCLDAANTVLCPLAEASGAKLGVFGAGKHAALPRKIQVDIVIIADVLHHVQLEDREQFLSDACRAVKPGGAVLFKDMASHPSIYALTNFAHDLLISGEIVKLTPIASVDSFMLQQNFILETAGRCRRLFYGHEWRLYRRPA